MLNPLGACTVTTKKESRKKKTEMEPRTRGVPMKLIFIRCGAARGRPPQFVVRRLPAWCDASLDEVRLGN